MAKLIIDMDDNRYKRLTSENESYLDYQILLAKLNNAIVLPDNCTNGDVIKTLLNLKDEDIKAKESCISGVILEYVIDTDIYFLRFDASWWDAPYEG